MENIIPVGGSDRYANGGCHNKWNNTYTIYEFWQDAKEFFYFPPLVSNLGDNMHFPQRCCDIINAT